MKHENKIFLNRLKRLLYFHTWSGNEEIMQDYVLDELKRLGFETKVDYLGNISAVRGNAEKYPLLNAHMDIVWWVEEKDLLGLEDSDDETAVSMGECYCKNCAFLWDCGQVLEEQKMIDDYPSGADYLRQHDISCNMFEPCELYDGYVDGSYDTYYGFYDSDENKIKYDALLEQQFEITYNKKNGLIKSNELRVLGGDDKCGVALALQIAEEMPNAPLKILFTVQEEVGCVGIRQFCKAQPEWFNDVEYTLTLDRRGGDDLLMYSAGGRNCSNEFASRLAFEGLKAGVFVHINSGTIADVMEIRNFVKENVNMSVGYYNAHGTDEYINFHEMLLIRDWIKNIIENVRV